MISFMVPTKPDWTGWFCQLKTNPVTLSWFSYHHGTGPWLFQTSSIRVTETTCFCEPSMLQKFSVPFPRSVPRYNPVSEVCRQFLGLHGLVCALTCTVTCGTLYRQVFAFPIISNQLNLPQVDSNQVVEKSQDDQWKQVHLSSILSVMAKAVNTYVHVISFVFLFLIN